MSLSSSVSLVSSLANWFISANVPNMCHKLNVICGLLLHLCHPEGSEVYVTVGGELTEWFAIIRPERLIRPS